MDASASRREGINACDITNNGSPDWPNFVERDSHSVVLSPITYEEVAYESPAELVTRDLVAPDGRHLHFQTTTQVDFSVSITKNDSTPLLAVETTLAEHRNAGLPGAGQYKAIQREDRVEVVPYQVLGADGGEHPVKAVTSYLISFPQANRSISATLDLIASQMSQASGKKVLIADQPYYVMDHMIELGASGETPGSLIARLGSHLGTILSYQVLYENRLSTYYMSIYPVTDPKIYGNLKNNKGPGAVQPSRQNPFVKK